MKRIIELCSRNAPKSSDVVKLRLRGKGSGFREGPTKEESADPLHLCISSRFYDKYKVACDCVQELILQVYEEYKKYCEKHRRDLTSGMVSKELGAGGLLHIKKHESITGRRSQVQQVPNSFNQIAAPPLPNSNTSGAQGQSNSYFPPTATNANPLFGNGFPQPSF